MTEDWAGMNDMTYKESYSVVDGKQDSKYVLLYSHSEDKKMKYGDEFC
jgi:ubiquitin C-terminal hydrolase